MLGACPIKRSRTIPTRLIDSTHTIYISIGWAIDSYEILWCFCFNKTCPPTLNSMSIQSRSSPITGKRGICPFFGKTGFVNVDPSATGTSAIISQWRYDLICKIQIQTWISMVIQSAKVMKPNIPSSSVIGIIPAKKIE